MGLAYFMLGDNDAAIEWLQRSLDKNPQEGGGYADLYLAMAYALKGDDAKARAAASEALRLDPNWKLSAFIDKPVSSSSLAYKSYYEKKFVPAWLKAGLPE